MFESDSTDTGSNHPMAPSEDTFMTDADTASGYVDSIVNSPVSTSVNTEPVATVKISEPPLQHIQEIPAVTQSLISNKVWNYLPDDIATNWSDDASNKLFNKMSILVDGRNLTQLITLFYELILSTDGFRLKIHDVASLVLKAFELDPSLTPLFLQSFSFFSTSHILISLLKLLNIDDSLLLLYLEPQVCIKLGITTSMFEKKIVRTNTNLLYKQKRFNLLREETEGYSKLFVELVDQTHSSSNSTPDSLSATVESLIGFFDLDPNRCLDIVLDTLMHNVLFNARFCLDFLKCTSYWPSVIAKHESIETLDVGGNKIAAQLLGFKFRCYTENKRETPGNLLALTSLLIKEGFVSLAQLYNFLEPSEDEMLKLDETWKRTMQEKAFLARSSALALAAPLADEVGTLPSSTRNTNYNTPEPITDTESTSSVEQETVTNQKVELLKYLLSVGSVNPALFILSRYPFLAGCFDEVTDLLNRIVNYSVNPYYQKIKNFTNPNDITKRRLVPASSDKSVFTLKSPKNMSTKRILYPFEQLGDADTLGVFFYDEWVSELEVVENIDELKLLSNKFLKFVGPRLARDPSLIVKLCRIGIHHIRALSNNDISPWLEYFRNFIFPCISLIDDNPGVIYEIFTLMRCFPLETRYGLYGEWSAVILKSTVELKLSSGKAEKETKNVLKRLSKTNVKEMMRKLAKISYSNPLTTFTALISQVESYDNLGELVVEAARYFTDMGWDALPFVIINQLTSGRSTLQGDGLTDRKWLQSLSAFTAKLCAKYSLMDPSPIVLTVLRELHKDNTSSIVILKELLGQMAGIAQLSNITSAQAQSLGGGPILKSSVYKVIEDTRHECTRSGKRLANMLVSSSILAEVFVVISQLHKTAIFKAPDSESYQKVLGTRYDELTHVLSQYIEALSTFLESSVFTENMPKVHQLCVSYGVDPVWAFAVWRQVIGDQVRSYSPPKKSSAVRTGLNTCDASQDISEEPSGNEDSSPAPKELSWHPALTEIMEGIMPIIPETEWKYLSPGLYVSFWQLSLYDIEYSAEVYDIEERKLQDSLRIITETLRNRENGLDKDGLPIRTLKANKDDASDKLLKLQAESKRHQLYHEKTKNRLRTEKDSWFDYDGGDFKVNNGRNVRSQLIQKFLVHCILPRALSTPVDAVFCARFIFMLHRLGCANFSSLSFFDKLFADGILYATLFTCTSYEAENLGLFFSETLRVLNNWRSKPEIYSSDGQGKRESNGTVSYLPGMQLKFGDLVTEESILSYEHFRRAIEKWHRHTYHAIAESLKNNDYMCRRNTITLLRNMMGVFPAITSYGWSIVDIVETITKTETREDLKLSATALFGHLKRRSDEWIELWDFKAYSDEQKEILMKEARTRNELHGIKTKPKSSNISTPVSSLQSSNALPTASLSENNNRLSNSKTYGSESSAKSSSSTSNSLPRSDSKSNSSRPDLRVTLSSRPDLRGRPDLRANSTRPDLRAAALSKPDPKSARPDLRPQSSRPDLRSAASSRPDLRSAASSRPDLRPSARSNASESSSLNTPGRIPTGPRGEQRSSGSASHEATSRNNLASEVNSIQVQGLEARMRQKSSREDDKEKPDDVNESKLSRDNSRDETKTNSKSRYSRDDANSSRRGNHRDDRNERGLSSESNRGRNDGRELGVRGGRGSTDSKDLIPGRGGRHNDERPGRDRNGRDSASRGREREYSTYQRRENVSEGNEHSESNSGNFRKNIMAGERGDYMDSEKTTKEDNTDRVPSGPAALRSSQVVASSGRNSKRSGDRDRSSRERECNRSIGGDRNDRKYEGDRSKSGGDESSKNGDSSKFNPERFKANDRAKVSDRNRGSDRPKNGDRDRSERLPRGDRFERSKKHERASGGDIENQNPEKRRRKGR